MYFAMVIPTTFGTNSRPFLQANCMDKNKTIHNTSEGTYIQ